MYAVRNWNEEIVKWLAVGIVLAMAGLVMVPLNVGDVGAVIGGLQAGVSSNSWEQAVVSGAWNGFNAGAVGAGVYLGLLGLGVATGGTAFAVGLGIAL
ncbi:hypothetical protein [Geoglobus acetivorans]|uniref:hypothetical protein n=1 Tax=Geoglobus acetivorans TaxID=565033 RepID=UPI0011DC742A